MKPTPLQARALRLLSTDEAAHLNIVGRASVDFALSLDYSTATRAERTIFNERADRFILARKEADVKRVRWASAEAMERAGWLERRETKWRGVTMVLTPAGREIIELLDPEDFISTPSRKRELPSMALIYGALRDRWVSENGWVWFTEFSPGVADRRVDALAVNRWGNKRGYERMVFEIKRTRADFLGELRSPEKTRQSASVADRFWFVVPTGLVEPTEVPGDCGLVWVDEDGHAQIKRKAPRRLDAPTDRRLLGAILTYIIDRPAQQEWRRAMKYL